MASLLDKLKSSKDKTTQTSIGPGGRLTSTSTVGTTQLAQDLGTSVPTTPLSVAGVGGNPNQAKMAGTPNQLKNANAVNLGSVGQTLSEYGQESFQAAQAGQDELNQQANVKRMETLGDLAPRVQQMINQSVTTAAASSPALGLIATTGLSTDLTEALNKFAQGDKKQLPLIAKALNKDALELNYDDLLKMYQNADAAVIDNIVKQVPDSIKVSQSLLGEQVNMAELSQTLGKDVSQLSITQLDEEMTKYLNQQQFGIDGLRARAADPNTSGSERAAIYEQLRQAGVQGEEGIAQRASEMEAQVNQGLSVEFNGQVYTVDKLLADETVSGLVKEYLNNPDSNAAKDLAKLSPALIDFINKNKAALKDASDKLSGTTTAVKDTIKTNRDIVKTGTVDINKALITELFGADWENQTDLLDTSKFPSFAFLKDTNADPTAKNNFATNLNDMYRLNPSIAKQAMGMSPAELANAGLTRNPSEPDSAINIYKLAVGIKERAGSVDWSNPEAALEALLGYNLPDDQTNQVFSDYSIGLSTGLANPNPELEGLLDLRNHASEYQNLDTNNLASLMSKLSGKGLTGGVSTITRAAGTLSNNPEISALRPFMGDSRLTQDEAWRLSEQMGNPQNSLNLLSRIAPATFGDQGVRDRVMNSQVSNIMFRLAKANNMDGLGVNSLINARSYQGTDNEVNSLQQMSSLLNSEYANPNYNAAAKAALGAKIREVNSSLDRAWEAREAKKRADNAEKERQAAILQKLMRK